MSSVIPSICKRATLAAALFSCALTAQATDENTFNAEELSKIRGISQALLHSRGQKREQVIAENQKVFENRALVDQALERAKREALTQVSKVEFVAQTGTDEVVLDDLPIQQRFNRWYQHLSQRVQTYWLEQGSPEKAERALTSLQSAEQKMRTYRSDLESGIAPAWKVWVENNSEDEKLAEKLAELEVQLQEMNQSGATVKTIKAFQKRWSGQQYSASPSEPTFYTITKHHQ